MIFRKLVCHCVDLSSKSSKMKARHDIVNFDKHVTYRDLSLLFDIDIRYARCTNGQQTKQWYITNQYADT